MLNTNGQLKISDFACAVKLDDNKQWSSSTHPGTTSHISPEVLNDIKHNKQRSYGLETDYWSYGTLLYFIRSRCEAFGYDESNDVCKNILDFKPGTLEWMEDDEDIQFADQEKDLINNLLCFEYFPSF